MLAGLGVAGCLVVLSAALTEWAALRFTRANLEIEVLHAELDRLHHAQLALLTQHGAAPPDAQVSERLAALAGQRAQRDERLHALAAATRGELQRLQTGLGVFLVSALGLLAAFYWRARQQLRAQFTAARAQRALNESLEQQQRELQRLNQELDSFSYSVSHDLRAPLRAVEGYASMLEEDHGERLDDEGRRYITRIREGAARMGYLIQSLLEFARLGRQPLALAPVDMAALLQEVRSEVAAAHRGVDVDWQVDELPMVDADRQLLRQVWSNLLDNAVKYSSRTPQPRIEVSARREGAEIVFCVADNGAGFDPRYQDKLFKPFQRLHSETQFKGTGLGLALVQRVVSRHGGRVWAESSPGQGARFQFSLPVRP